MNERIGELHTQALEYADSKVPPEHRYNDIYYAIVCHKIADLTVKECANIVNSLEQHEGPGDCATVEYIKEHFGVE